MALIKNDQLLNTVLKAAIAIGGDDCPTGTVLTVEKFVAAAIQVTENSYKFGITASEERSLREVLEEYLPSENGMFDSVRKCLMDYIGDDPLSPEYAEDKMIKHINKARSKASSNGEELLTTTDVLLHIFSKPTKCITKCIFGPEENPFDEIEIVDEIEDMDYDDFDDDWFEEYNESDPREIADDITRRIKTTYDRLTEEIFGQDNAISVLTTGLFQAELHPITDKNRRRPRATFLFAGPPGVGKTFLAEKAAEILELPYMRFDMSEYSDKEATLQFCGSDKVYKNGSEGNVTGFVDKNPRCILLFDEIEKAHVNVIHLFLQLLDAGRLRDCYTDNEVSFTDAIIILTTNAGRPLYEDPDTSDYSAVSRKVILKALQDDINPETNAPYFPAAICSRFASGNVVMFNHIMAHNLRDIAKKEILRSAANLEHEFGIRVDIDENVFTAVLFAEGGAADARTIRGYAENFFDDEIYELFRLIGADKVRTNITDIGSISIKVELPSDNDEIRSLYESSDRQEVLVFASKQTAALCRKSCPDVKMHGAQTLEKAKTILDGCDIGFVLVDMRFGADKEDRSLNLEDIASAAREFFWLVKSSYADLPVYILQLPQNELSSEEMLSFRRSGARGFMTLTDDRELFASQINAVGDILHQQSSMKKLARANRVVRFETAQTISEDGSNAQIRLFDFEMETAFDAEDSKSILSNVSKPNVRFEQVIGASDAKRELQYFVEYLKNPKRYRNTGVSAPKGVLLYGPPGTGKTMLAKAMACESDVTFIAAEGNQFVGGYVGAGAARVHKLFRTARKYAPAILFIDEIDAIAKERRGSDSDLEATLTAFLTEMDGFKNDVTKPVFVLAATNFDVEPGSPKSLDPALMRRFDRRINIDLPGRDDRIRYMKMRFAENHVFKISEEKIGSIAVRSTGMSLNELASVIEFSLRTALRSAISSGDIKVTDEIFDEAFETFNFGEEKKWEASQLERTARHEAGHAFLYWENGDTPSYMTITARGDHGGYMQRNDNEDKHLYTKSDLLARIRTALGGRAAEIVYYGEEDGVSTGAANDLYQATRTAQHIVCSYGMDGSLGLASIDKQAALYGELSVRVHDAVNRILDAQLAEAIKIISENRRAIDALVEQLLAENQLSGEQIDRICADNSQRKHNI